MPAYYMYYIKINILLQNVVDQTIFEGVVAIFHIDYFMKKLYAQLLHFKWEFFQTLHLCRSLGHFWRGYSPFWKPSYILNGITRYLYQKMKNVGKRGEVGHLFKVSKITFDILKE